MTEDFNPFAAPQAIESSPHDAWATDHPKALRRVKTGLNFVYFGICGLVVSSVAMPVSLMMLLQPDADLKFIWLVVAIAVATIALGLLILAGEWLCTAVPIDSGGKKLATVAIVLQGASVVACIGSKALEETASIKVAIAAVVIGGLLAVASLGCFAVFMRRMAKYIERADLVGRATRVLIVGGVTLMLFVGTFVFTSVDGPQNDFPWLRGLFLIAGLMAFVSLIMYANMVTYLRKAITA